MRKVTTSICLDVDVIDEVKKLVPNLSGEINEYLKALIAQKSGDLEEISVEIAKKRAEKAQKRIKEQQILVKKYENIIEKVTTNKEKAELSRLEDEKKEAEKSKKCQNCGIMIPEKAKKELFAIGFVCRSCYLGATSDDLEKWTKKNQ